MMKRWRMLGWPALLAAAIATAPAVAADTDNQQPDLKAINDTLTEIKNKLAALDTINEKVTTLGVQVQKAQADATKANGDVTELTKEVLRLQREVAALKDRMSSATQSLYGPTRATPGVGAGIGRIRLRNTFAEPVSIVVNEAAYELAPGETYTMEAPAGNFTYEVLGIQRPVTRTLAVGETFTINVYTR